MGAAFAVGEQWVHLVIAQADALERFGHSVATCAATAMKAHDIFNIGCMAGMVMLTFATPFFPALNVPLAFTILAYAAIDMLWLCVQPHIFDSPRMVGAHHLAVMVVAFHAATHTPHNKFTSWSACAEVEAKPTQSLACDVFLPLTRLPFVPVLTVAIVEFNTLILTIKKRVPTATTAWAVLDLAFKVTWVVTRMLWFPILAVHLSLQPDFPSVGRRVLCSSCAYGLALLQWIWTVRGEKRPTPTTTEAAVSTATTVTLSATSDA